MEELPDGYLYLLSLEHNEEAYKILYKKYKNVIKSILKKYIYKIKEFGFEYEDLIYECNLYYLNGLYTYNNFKDVSLKTYLYKCIENGLLNYFKMHQKETKMELDSEIVLEIIKDYRYLPDNNVLLNDFITELKDSLSITENMILDYLLSGETFDEITKNLEITKRQLYNSINRIRTKTKLIMQF